MVKELVTFKYLRIAVLICLFFNPLKLKAGDFYSDCVKGDDYGNDNISEVLIYPLNVACIERCQAECNGFSRLLDGQELNTDVITACQTDCQNGLLFSSSYRDVQYQNTGSTKSIIVRAPVQINIACTDQNWAKYNIYDANFQVRANDQLILSLVNTNKIYLCGNKNVVLNPSPAYSDISSWNAQKTQTYWNSKVANACLSQLSDSDFNSLTNAQLWDPDVPLPETSTNKDQTGAYGICKWNARNYNFTNTGIYVANGDELTINWNGNYNYNSVMNDGFGSNFSIDDLAACTTNKRFSQAQIDFCAYTLFNMTSLELMNSTQTDFAQTVITPVILAGEQARSTSIGINVTPDGVESKNYGFSRYDVEGSLNQPLVSSIGLSGKVLDLNLVTNIDTEISGCSDITNQSIYYNINCMKIKSLGMPTYLYSGILSNWHDDRSLLGIRHPSNPDIDATKFVDDYVSNHTGGFNVNITWKGCPRVNGQQLQYTVSDSASNITEDMWINISDDALSSDATLSVFQQGNYLTIPSKFFDKMNTTKNLFFRIKPLDTPEITSAVYGDQDKQYISNLYNNPGSYSGNYDITIKKNLDYQSKLVLKGGPISKIVQAVYETMLGTSTQTGVIQKIFSAIINQNQYIQVVRAVLVLYMSIFALSVVIGIVEINQKESITRLVKFAFIVAMISPTAWDFFGSFVTPLFVQGSLELINMVINLTLSNEIIDPKNPFAVFEIIDLQITQIFSSAIWKKIYALICTGLIGMVVACAIIIACLLFSLTLIKMTLIYIFSILGVSFILIMSPIFLILMLFTLTKDLFDRWWKNLLSYTLQPVMVFSSYAMFNAIITTLLYGSLSFSACSYCILGVDFGALYSACWIPGYRTLLGSHMPSNVPNFFIPINAASVGLAFVLCAHTMWVFTSYIIRVTSTLVTGNWVRPESNPVENMQKSAVNTARDTAKTAAIASIQAAGNTATIAATVLTSGTTTTAVKAAVDTATAAASSAVETVGNLSKKII